MQQATSSASTNASTGKSEELCLYSRRGSRARTSEITFLERAVVAGEGEVGGRYWFHGHSQKFTQKTPQPE